MGSEPGVDWRAKWPDLDLEEKVKINTVFDMFLRWFLMALRDVISGPMDLWSCGPMDLWTLRKRRFL